MLLLIIVHNVYNILFFFQMISFLGVSKAVLDNVIFCHQEESNWWVLDYLVIIMSSRFLFLLSTCLG